VVAYTGIQGRTHNAIVEADAANVAKKMELAKVDLGRYPVSYTEFPDGLKLSRSAYNTSTSNVYYCLNRNTDQYAFGLISKGGKEYIVISGRVSEVPSAYATAVCETVGQTWGSSDANRITITGYYGSASVWNTLWSWTN
jgi:hypothetical protein